MKIRCYTLFDITKTNVSHRRTSYNIQDSAQYVKQRNQQTNFETLLQIISMRSQPENITEPKKIRTDLHTDDRWGSELSFKHDDINVWSFSFTIYHTGVFDDGINELGNLFSDCTEVPMILNLDESITKLAQLNISSALKNIHFEIEHDD